MTSSVFHMVSLSLSSWMTYFWPSLSCCDFAKMSKTSRNHSFTAMFDSWYHHKHCAFWPLWSHRSNDTAAPSNVKIDLLVSLQMSNFSTYHVSVLPARCLFRSWYTFFNVHCALNKLLERNTAVVETTKFFHINKSLTAGGTHTLLSGCTNLDSLCSQLQSSLHAATFRQRTTLVNISFRFLSYPRSRVQLQTAFM